MFLQRNPPLLTHEDDYRSCLLEMFSSNHSTKQALKGLNLY